MEDADRFFSGMVVPLNAAHYMADEHFKTLAIDPTVRNCNMAACRFLKMFFRLKAIKNCVWE